MPLLGETIGANLRRTVERHPDRDAMVLEAHQTLIDEVPWVPLIELVNPIALGPDVESFRMDIFRRIIPEELAKN